MPRDSQPLLYQRSERAHFKRTFKSYPCLAGNGIGRYPCPDLLCRPVLGIPSATVPGCSFAIRYCRRIHYSGMFVVHWIRQSVHQNRERDPGSLESYKITGGERLIQAYEKPDDYRCDLYINGRGFYNPINFNPLLGRLFFYLKSRLFYPEGRTRSFETFRRRISGIQRTRPSMDTKIKGMAT